MSILNPETIEIAEWALLSEQEKFERYISAKFRLAESQLKEGEKIARKFGYLK